MPTKTNNSALYNKDPFSFLTGDTGANVMGPITEDQLNNAASGGLTAAGGAGLGVAGQVGSIASSMIDTSDPLRSKDHVAASATQDALKYGAMGLQYGGPIGGLVGGAFGGIYGALSGKKELKVAQEGHEKNKGNEMATLLASRGGALTMEGPLKMLTSVEGNVPHNKSARQHDSDNKMNAIAMSGITSKY